MIDTDEQDHEFFDVLYQQWAKTTGAETDYWMPEEDNDYYDGGPGNYIIWSVKQIGAETAKGFVGRVSTEEDADFICGLHGAIPDLIRQLHEAIDEATRKDEANDIAQGQLAEALLENQGLREQIRELEALVASRTEQVMEERHKENA
ncbi:hypothetical protein SEA_TIPSYTHETREX_37 [Mycobacterium phage TipsytheTRex]|nr:hypothetical protein SEA_TIPSYTHETREX_37 [Mycobacterium phage TipsytheTRex]